MRATDERTRLREWLDLCEVCKVHFLSNIGTIVENGYQLTNEQATSVLRRLLDFHGQHV